MMINSARKMDIPCSDRGGKPAFYAIRAEKEPARKSCVDKEYGVFARDNGSILNGRDHKQVAESRQAKKGSPAILHAPRRYPPGKSSFRSCSSSL